MTRENKLALVIGFALILFVGILISDHFSAARLDETASLDGGVVDPLMQAGHDDPDLVQLQMLNNSATLRGGGGGHPQPAAAAAVTEPDELEIYMGRPGQIHPQAIGLDDAGGDVANFRFHEVRPGESLSSIAKYYYGDTYNALQLARFNKIDNPNRLSVGHRLRIPLTAPAFSGLASSGNANPSSASPTPPAPDVTQYASYTIRSGDVLSKVAQRLMGTSKRTNELYELNRNVITNPDRLIPGTVIKVPKE